VDIGAQTPIPRAPKEAALPRLIVARVLAQDGRKNRAHHKVLDHAVAGNGAVPLCVSLPILPKCRAAVCRLADRGQNSPPRVFNIIERPELGCILADEFEEADFAGSLIDRSAMLASSANQGKVPPAVELSDLHAHVYGDFAYVRGLAVIRSDDGKLPVKNRFTDIFIYRDGRWQCVAGHESHFPERR
jgi:hypothetical protein